MIRTILSPRAIIFLTLVLAFLLRFRDFEEIFGTAVNFLQILIAILLVSVVSLAITAFKSFDIESKTEFVLDISIDLIFFGASIGMLIYLSTLGFYGAKVSSHGVYLTCIALGLSVMDFLVSLNAGAGKLLEMDREHLTRDRNY